MTTQKAESKELKAESEAFYSLNRDYAPTGWDTFKTLNVVISSLKHTHTHTHTSISCKIKRKMNYELLELKLNASCKLLNYIIIFIQISYI